MLLLQFSSSAVPLNSPLTYYTTVLQTFKLHKCRMRKRRPLDWLVRIHLAKYLTNQCLQLLYLRKTSFLVSVNEPVCKR